MSQRITLSFVEAKVATVNRLLGFTRNIDDAYFHEEGRVTLNRAYGGTKVTVFTSHRGESELSQHGYGTLKEAAIFLDGMRQTLYLVNEHQGRQPYLPIERI